MSPCQSIINQSINSLLNQSIIEIDQSNNQSITLAYSLPYCYGGIGHRFSCTTCLCSSRLGAKYMLRLFVAGIFSQAQKARASVLYPPPPPLLPPPISPHLRRTPPASPLPHFLCNKQTTTVEWRPDWCRLQFPTYNILFRFVFWSWNIWLPCDANF